MKKLFLLVILFSSFSLWSAEQKLPSCQRLNELWVTKYYRLLNPNWALENLPCGKLDSQLTKQDKLNMNIARAAFMLDETIFDRSNVPTTPIVSYGKIQTPPFSMLLWVADRSEGLVYDSKARSAYANIRWNGKGWVHLTPADFGVDGPLTSGIGLAGQLIHEARHIGFPYYGHVNCKLPGITGPNCDPTISEEFEGGGSHATAAIWLAWIYSRSYWPAADKQIAADVVKWVLLNRINDSYAVKNAFSQRYLGTNL